MVIILLAKVVKMSWFDHPELQSIVHDLEKFYSVSDRHLLIALQVIEDLIIEMSYVHKVKNLNASRRISLNFRDTALFIIFKQCLEFVKRFSDQISAQLAFQQITLMQRPINMGQFNNDFSLQGGDQSAASHILCESLFHTLSILEKCFSFDFSAILLNETLDDPACTNIPTAWCPFIQQPETIKNFFRILEADIRSEKSTAIKVKAAQCLAHLANVRHSIFDSAENRIAFVTLFVQDLIVFLTSPALANYVLKDRQLYKEFVPIPLKI